MPIHKSVITLKSLSLASVIDNLEPIAHQFQQAVVDEDEQGLINIFDMIRKYIKHIFFSIEIILL